MNPSRSEKLGSSPGFEGHQLRDTEPKKNLFVRRVVGITIPLLVLFGTVFGVNAWRHAVIHFMKKTLPHAVKHNQATQLGLLGASVIGSVFTVARLASGPLYRYPAADGIHTYFESEHEGVEYILPEDSEIDSGEAIHKNALNRYDSDVLCIMPED